MSLRELKLWDRLDRAVRTQLQAERVSICLGLDMLKNNKGEK